MSYRFDDFELDPDRAELRQSGQPVRVEPQVFDLLKLLVSAKGRMVTRDEIFEAIWGNRIVSDAALSSRIKDARKALGDSGSTQKYIRTVQRRGLVFVGEVTTVAPPAPPDTAPRPRSTGSEDPLARAAIAVLPFEDLTGDDLNSPFARSLSHELSAVLSSWRTFRVIARHSAQHMDAGSHDATRIGSALHADYLLHGTLRRTETTVKLRMTLTHAEDNSDIWSDRLTCELKDLIEVEEEIAAQIATRVAPELQGSEARRVLRKSAADWTPWDIAMRAVFLLRMGKSRDLQEAERLAHQACEIAPDWSLPFTLVAIARFQMAMTGFSSADSREAFRPTLEAAQKALEIDHNAWLAQALTGVGELWTHHNHDKAILHIERAIALNSSAAINYHFGGCITGFAGDLVKARGYQERLFRIDPTYPYRAVIEADLGLWHMLGHEYDQAGDRLDRANAWDPSYGRGLQRRIALCGLTDQREAAQAAAQHMQRLGLPLDYDTIASSYPFRHSAHAELFLDGLRRSGVNV